MKEYEDFIWSGHEWLIQKDIAWFIDAESDMLCRVDIQTGKCDCIARMPYTGADKFMLNTRCIAVKDEIFCMPCYGNRIWIYNTLNATFQYIKIEKQAKFSLYMEFCWSCGDELFSVSRGLRQVIVVDVNTKEIMYYPIDVRENDILLSCCVKVGNKIYCTSYNSNRIYQFDIETKKTEVYIMPQIKETLALICFDGEKFWLSGCSKKIYVWDKDKSSVRIIENFPKQFGNYNFCNNIDAIIDHKIEKCEFQLFCRLEHIGEYIWAIPFRSNFVLYINKNTFEVCVLPISGEEETKQSLTLTGRRQFKYFWQYLRDDRYMGIFSLKNNYIVEIDTVVRNATPKNYILSYECLKIIWDERILSELDSRHKSLFSRLIKLSRENVGVHVRENRIGSRIYSQLK